MRKNFDVPLRDARGREVRDDKDNLVLLSDVAITALTEPMAGDEDLTGKEKFALSSLAIRIGEGGQAEQGGREYSKEELVTIKNRALKNVRILAYGRLCEVIDSDEQPGNANA